MAENPTLAFLQTALGVSGANAPVEETALYNLFMQRMLTSGFTLSNAGLFGFTSALDGQVLIGKTSDHSLNLATLTAGANVTITNAAGAITIAAAAPGIGTVTHTAGALTTSALVVGNGAADIDVLASLGTTTTVLHGNAAGRPTFGAIVNADITNATIDLAAKVTGTLPVTNGGSGVATNTTAYGVLAAGTTATGAIQNVGVGTTGYTLTSGGAAALPAYVATGAPVVFALSDGATPALDASKGTVFTLAAGGDRTIAVPSNATSGQKIILAHNASGGARTLALNSGAGGFRFGSDIASLSQTASGKTDYIGCVYNAGASVWDVVAVTKGF